MVHDPQRQGLVEVELTRAAARGEEEAQRQLVERLLPRVRTTLHYLAGGDRDADDLVQNALVTILRSAQGYRGEASLERWADRIAVRTALRALRKRRRREQIVRPMADMPEVGRGTEGELRRRQLRRQLAWHLGRLNPQQRATIVLHWVRGYTVDEIAGLTEASAHTVRDRLHAGKAKLKKWMQKDPALVGWAMDLHDEPHES